MVMYQPLQMGSRFAGKITLKHMDASPVIKDVAKRLGRHQDSFCWNWEITSTPREKQKERITGLGGITDENARDFTVDFSLPG